MAYVFASCNPFSGVRPSIVRPQYQTSYSPKTLGQSKSNLMRSPWVGGTKVCSRHLGHMTIMVSSIRAGLESMTSQNGGQDGRDGSNTSPVKGYDL